jgi:2-polyprenyl-3-methyl-5-hydroxy-6-metoxy-1,4-benzoquinol methylase
MEEKKEEAVSLNLLDYCCDLEWNNGVWIGSKEKVSYPEDGSNDCFEIEDSSYWFQHRNKCINSVAQEFALGKVFFDIGGGNGVVTKHLQENGFEAILVEPSGDGIKNAKIRGVKHLVNGTLESSNFKKGTIPNIGVFDVVEHIEKDDLFLGDIYDYLIPGGVLFITVPAYNWLWSEDDDFAGHYRRYNLMGICKQLKEIGFEVKFSTYLFSILVIPIFILRTIKCKVKIWMKKSYDHKKYNKEHGSNNGLLTKFIKILLRKEFTKIEARKKVSFGSSCFIVAQKPNF